MIDELWSWLLGAVGLLGFYLAGRRVWWAWYVNIANQVLWIAYSIITEQLGFLVTAILYTVVFVKNASAWTKAWQQSKEFTMNKLYILNTHPDDPETSFSYWGPFFKNEIDVRLRDAFADYLRDYGMVEKVELSDADAAEFYINTREDWLRQAALEGEAFDESENTNG